LREGLKELSLAKLLPIERKSKTFSQLVYRCHKMAPIYPKLGGFVP
jgi:hypothetical protein